MTRMADWSPNNRACTTTWSTLKILAQNSKPFIKSGGLRMDQLTYWNPTASSEMRKVQATTLANQMDNVFTLVRGAKYEKKVTKEKAIASMTDVLVDSEMTVTDLAAVCNDQYVFWGENVNE